MAGVSGGEKLQKVLAEIGKKLGDGKILRAGFLETAKYPDGTPVAQVALWNDAGTETSPPRAFFRQTIAEHGKSWGNALGDNLKASGMDGDKALALTGEGIKDNIVSSIVTFSDPQNAPRTIAKKGFNKPLVDSGVMQRSVDYDIKDGLE